MTKHRDRGSYDLFGKPERGRFGDNESSDDRVQSVKLFDCTLTLRQDRDLSIMVTQGAGADERWISLPKSLIEFKLINPTTVEVTMPLSMAKEKGLV